VCLYVAAITSQHFCDLAWQKYLFGLCIECTPFFLAYFKFCNFQNRLEDCGLTFLVNNCILILQKGWSAIHFLFFRNLQSKDIKEFLIQGATSGCDYALRQCSCILRNREHVCAILLFKSEMSLDSAITQLYQLDVKAMFTTLSSRF
jgi:hypothetical protein